MTLRPVTITEEVINARGELVTQTRETLQLVTDPQEEEARQQAMSVNHPDYVSAQDRVYTAQDDGTSTSKPREVVEEGPEEAGDGELLEDEEVTEEESTEAQDELETETLCLHPIGNGECQLPAGHQGFHRLHVEDD